MKLQYYRVLPILPAGVSVINHYKPFQNSLRHCYLVTSQVEVSSQMHDDHSRLVVK